MLRTLLLWLLAYLYWPTGKIPRDTGKWASILTARSRGSPKLNRTSRTIGYGLGPYTYVVYGQLIRIRRSHRPPYFDLVSVASATLSCYACPSCRCAPMLDKPRVSTGAACLSPGGLPRFLSASAPVDTSRCKPRMTHYALLETWLCIGGYAFGVGDTMREAYESWQRKRAQILSLAEIP